MTGCRAAAGRGEGRRGRQSARRFQTKEGLTPANN